MTQPAPTILCVDDDPLVLDLLRRQLTQRGFTVQTAGNAADAQTQVMTAAPDAALVDLFLGRDDGVTVLADLAAVAPGTVRLAISGAGDYQASVRAINEGRVFAFLEKPWNADELAATLRAGLDVGEAHSAQKSLSAASAFGRPTPDAVWPFLESLEVLEPPRKKGHGARVAHAVGEFGRHLGLSERMIRDVQAAALVHDLGEVVLSDAVRETPEQRLSPQMFQEFARHPETGRELLAGIGGLDAAAEIVALHHERYDGKGFPRGLRGTEIPGAARVLAVIDAYDEAVNGHIAEQPMEPNQARSYLEKERGARLDSQATTAYLRWLRQQEALVPGDRELALGELEPGMVLAADLITPDGILLVPAGHRLNPALIQRITAFAGELSDLRAVVRQ